jgi:hypothetical protein
MRQAAKKDFAVEARKIVSYEVAWNTEQGIGQVSMKLDTGAETTIKVNSLAEIAGLCAILDKKPAYAPNEKWIHYNSENAK